MATKNIDQRIFAEKRTSYINELSTEIETFIKISGKLKLKNKRLHLSSKTFTLEFPASSRKSVQRYFEENLEKVEAVIDDDTVEISFPEQYLWDSKDEQSAEDENLELVNFLRTKRKIINTFLISGDFSPTDKNSRYKLGYVKDHELRNCCLVLSDFPTSDLCKNVFDSLKSFTDAGYEDITEDNGVITIRFKFGNSAVHEQEQTIIHEVQEQVVEESNDTTSENPLIATDKKLRNEIADILIQYLPLFTTEIAKEFEKEGFQLMELHLRISPEKHSFTLDLVDTAKLQKTILNAINKMRV